MSKIKIYELAKELDKPSKELVEFLNKKDVEAEDTYEYHRRGRSRYGKKSICTKGKCRKSRRGKI